MNKNKIIKLIISLIYVIFTIVFILKINSMNIIPNKYFIIGIVILVILNIISILCLMVKNKWLKIITILIYLMLTIGYIVGINYIDKTNEFIDHTFTNNQIESVKINYLLVSKNKYTEKQLYYRDVYYDKTDDHVDEAILKLNKKYTSNMKIADSSELYKKDVFFTSDFMYDELQENGKINPNDYNVLYNVELEIKFDKEETNSKKKDSYNIYLAARDFSGHRIDLNKVITVNTKTKEILITNVNRFSYLEIEGKGKNRLSSTGYYGVQYNKKAIEKELGIEIDYYFSVDTKSFVKLVDAVGGINYCSDQAYTTTHALVLGTYDDSKGKKLYVKKGCQHLNGIETLTVARERNAFKDWITQRERNCTAIMEDILNSAKKPSNITRYPEILDSMNGMYKTNIPKDTVQYGIKSLLNDKWTIKTQEIKGKYGSNSICFGREYGAVFYVDKNSSKKAGETINNLYNKTK